MCLYTDETQSHIASLDLKARKALGQYMTPSSIGDVMAEMLDIPDDPTVRVLDPSCGTGELLLAVNRICPSVTLYGFDVDQGMLDTAVKNVPDVKASLLSIFDAESKGQHGQYDYIIGNPPYFELKKDDPELAKGGVDGFASLEDKGRLNIYALFVEYALRLVRNGGKVAFLVPPSMNNGAFFKRLRKRVLELGKVDEIRLIRENDSFDDAMTSVQILLLERTGLGYEQNKDLSRQWVYETPSSIIFTDRKKAIEDFSDGKNTVADLGFTVKTGSVIWNQHKDQFVLPDIMSGGDDDQEGLGHIRADGQYEIAPAGTTLLLFSKDITKDNEVKLSGKISAPSHWIQSSAVAPLSEPAIIVNRIVGSLDNSRLRFAYVDGIPFCGENHVNVITREDKDAGKLAKLYAAFKAIDTKELSEYLKAVTGNTQLSATELGDFPIRI